MSLPAALISDRAARARTAPLFGRAGDLGRVISTVAAFGGAVVAGPAGIGKSRLAADAAQALAVGAVVTRVVATSAAATVPFAAITRLLPPALRELPGDRTAMFRSAATYLADARVVLIVDDAHLLDPGSAALIQHVVLTGAVQVLLTVRSGEVAPDAISGLWKDDIAPRVDLGPLDRDAVSALADHIVGHRVDARIKRLLWRATVGNPLYVREALLTTDIDTDQAGGAMLVGDRLSELIRSRLAGLDPLTRRALELVSVGGPLPVGVVRSAATPRAVDDLLRAGLVAVDPVSQAVTPDHPLLGEVVCELLSPTELAQICGELSVAMSDRTVGDSAEQIRLTLWQLRSGSGVLADDLIRAAELAVGAFDPVLAERFAREAVAADGGVRAVTACAAALLAQNRFAEAEELLAVQWPLLADTEPQVAMRLVRQWALALDAGLGRPREACVMLDEARDVCGDSNWDTMLSALRAHILAVVDPDAAARLGQEVIDDSRASVGSRVVALKPVVDRLCGQGRTDDAMQLVERFFTIVGETDDPVDAEVGMLFGYQADVRAAAGDLLTLAAELTSVRELAEQSDDEQMLGAARAGLGACAFEAGDLVTAQAHLWAARDHLAITDAANLHPWTMIVLASVCALTGDVATATEAIGAARESVAARPHDRYLRGELVHASVWFAAVADSPQAGAAIAIEAADVAGAPSERAHLGYLAHRLGAPDRVVADAMTAGAGTQSRRLRALADHGCALAAGRPPGTLERVAREYADMGYFVGAVEAWVESGRAYAATGSIRSSKRCFGRAQQLVATHLRGVTTPLISRLHVPELTVREHQVASLAARGRSNAEIAHELGRSVRTVEWHLQQAYGKLGVVGRAQLVDVLIPGTGR